MSQLLPARPRIAIERAPARLGAALFERLDALLLFVPRDAAAALGTLPHGALLARAHARRPRPALGCHLVPVPTRRGLAVVIGVLPDGADTFQRLTLAGRMRHELESLGATRIGLAALGTAARPESLEALLAAALVAAEPQPAFKSRTPRRAPAATLVVCGTADSERTAAVERGAHLARWLTALPANVLSPRTYRRALGQLAARHGWRMRVHDEAALRRAGAGAFLAVSRGSARRDAALVHLQYRPRGRAARLAPIALVGKGLCFDTGGHNLKPAKAMFDMHTDMAGSAVALGVLEVLTATGYPRPVDAWLALAENRIGPDAYTQQDVVTAANGTTIQVAHTDAEGRMVLADALSLAARTRPALIVDFATLTGACVAALTERYSGVFTNRSSLRGALEAAGARSGERVWTFPTPADFDEDLESKPADIVQCLLDGKGDHIYAARFLSRFVPAGMPWVHVDLSSAQRAGGLAHVRQPLTGFGVRFAIELLADRDFLASLAHPEAAARD